MVLLELTTAPAPMAVANGFYPFLKVIFVKKGERAILSPCFFSLIENRVFRVSYIQLFRYIHLEHSYWNNVVPAQSRRYCQDIKPSDSKKTLAYLIVHFYLPFDYPYLLLHRKKGIG